MKYLYKHGNQFWYQRAVPKSIYKHIKKKSIKICLKTNKLEVAILRAKQQSKKHSEMFQNFSFNRKNYLSNLINSGNFNLKKFQVEFKEDYKDFVEDFLFSKKKFIENFATSQKLNITNTSLDKYLFYNDYLSNNIMSTVIEDCLKKKIKLNFILNNHYLKSLNAIILICGDKIIHNYNNSDVRIFKNYFINSKKITIGKKYQKALKRFLSGLQINFNIEIKNPFNEISWPEIEIRENNKFFSKEDLFTISEDCLKKNDVVSHAIGLMQDTGCRLNEIYGLSFNDFFLSKYQSYIIIRSNEIREIKNVYSKRTIPLVGHSLWSASEIIKFKKKYYFYEKNNFSRLSKLVNQRLKKLTKKTSFSFGLSLTERLKEINCPESIILDILGKTKKNIIYNQENSIEIKSSWLKQIVK
tara:strand:- start:1260 stop:2498 length:1239 start_codon:yes stop_codon:yes gene_type:complete